MSFVISSVLPFPNIYWWSQILDTTTVYWDLSEPFRKMTYRNRYYLAGGNGLLKLSLPLQGGRDHRTDMAAAGISYDQDWPRQHWRTIESAYNNAPFFPHYLASFRRLFETGTPSLLEFNLASIHWLKDQIGFSFDEVVTGVPEASMRPDLIDLRSMKPGAESGQASGFPHYYQVFSDRIGFLPNLSVLDLLFAEGPYTLHWLKVHREQIRELGRSGSI